MTILTSWDTGTQHCYASCALRGRGRDPQLLPLRWCTSPVPRPQEGRLVRQADGCLHARLPCEGRGFPHLCASRVDAAVPLRSRRSRSSAQGSGHLRQWVLHICPQARPRESFAGYLPTRGLFVRLDIVFCCYILPLFDRSRIATPFRD